MVSAPEPTKLHYLDGRPTELTLRRIKLEVLKGDRVETHTFDQRETITMGAADDNDLVLRDAGIGVSNFLCRCSVRYKKVGWSSCPSNQTSVSS